MITLRWRFPAAAKISAVAKKRRNVRFRPHAAIPRPQPGIVTTPRSTAVDDALRSFIEGAFPSVWALETFLALKRNGEVAWTVEGLVKELRANTSLVTDCLGHLERAGLAVAIDGTHRYQPASKTLAKLADDLQAVYAERPFSIISAITSRRPDPLKGFADSFRLGGWKQ